MNGFWSDWEFLAVLAAAALVVGFHAYESYRTEVPEQSLRFSPFFSKPFATGVRPRFLTSRRKFLAGFLVYLSSFEALFLLLSSSTAILDLSMSIVGSTATVGALSRGVDGIGLMTPVLAATATIAISGFKLFAGIENFVRRLAYRTAGIPRDLDVVFTRVSEQHFLEKLQVDDELAEIEMPMRNRGWQNDEPPENEETLRLLYRLMREGEPEHVLPDEARAVLIRYRGDIRDAYDAAMASSTSTRGFPTEEISAQAEHEASTARRVARNRRQDERVDATVERFQRLISVILVNCLEDSADIDRSTPLGRVAHAMKTRIVGGAALPTGKDAVTTVATGFAFAVALGSVCYLWLYVYNDIWQSQLLFHSEAQTLLVLTMPEGKYLLFAYGRSLIRAAWEAGGVGLIFLSAHFVVAAVRSSHFPPYESRDVRRRRAPVLGLTDMASMAALSTAVGIPVYFGFVFLKLVLSTQFTAGGVASYPSLLNDFGELYLSHVILALLSVPVSLAICRINHGLDVASSLTRESEVAFGTVWRYAFAGGLINAWAQLLIGSLASVADFARAATLPMLYVLVYLLVYRSNALNRHVEMRKVRREPRDVEDVQGNIRWLEEKLEEKRREARREARRDA